MVEAHKLKEFIKDAIFEGNPPKPVVHESFLRDAAKNEALVKELLPALKALVRHLTEGTIKCGVVAGLNLDKSLADARAAIAKAEGH